jgi:hypothetical protein
MEADALTEAERKYDLDWSRADPDATKFILKQGELILDSQLRIALAADQRAMVTAGLLTGIAASMFAAAVAYYARSGPGFPYLSTYLLGLGIALLWPASSAIKCASPAKFGHAGSSPNQLWKFRDEKNFTAIIGAETENYQERIDSDEFLDANGSAFRRAIKRAIVAPFIALIICLFCRLLWTIPAVARLLS